MSRRFALSLAIIAAVLVALTLSNMRYSPWTNTSARAVDQRGPLSDAERANIELFERVSPSVVLLDGKRDWLNAQPPHLVDVEFAFVAVPPVVTRVKADRYCASVAAASVLAKVRRDSLLDELAQRYPGYGWEHNKGYVTAAHREAIARMGLTPEHRRSWNLVS